MAASREGRGPVVVVLSLAGARAAAKGTVIGGNDGTLLLFQAFGIARRTGGMTPLTGN